MAGSSRTAFEEQVNEQVGMGRNGRTPRNGRICNSQVGI